MRLDNYLQSKYPSLSRSKIQDLIKRNLVLVNDKIITKTGFMIKDSDIVVLLEEFRYVSRAGYKLEHAARELSLDFKDLTIIDVGSSTGGFSDFALQNGVKLIYAYDVGSNQMVDKIKNNSKVILNENANILDVVIKKVDLVLIDVSFTSSLPILRHVSTSNDKILLLIKPQFEVGQKYLNKGIVKDKKRVDIILDQFRLLSTSLGFNYKIFTSGLSGKDGNLEYWMYLVKY